MIRNESAGNALEALGRARDARDKAQAEVRRLKADSETLRDEAKQMKEELRVLKRERGTIFGRVSGKAREWSRSCEADGENLKASVLLSFADYVVSRMPHEPPQ